MAMHPIERIFSQCKKMDVKIHPAQAGCFYSDIEKCN